MDVEIGTEAAQFPEKEYRNGISLQCMYKERRFMKEGTMCFLQYKLGMKPWLILVHRTLLMITEQQMLLKRDGVTASHVTYRSFT